MMSSGVMAALQILVLPVKVRVLARQHRNSRRPATGVVGLFIVGIMIAKEQIIKLAGEALEGTDRYVVNVTVSNDNVIELFIDSDTAVTIDDCVELSRYVEEHLDRETEDFELSVSSAGIDEPLLVTRQYGKYIGGNVFITKKDSEKKMYKLISFNDLQVEVQEAEAKKYGKLTKILYHDNATILIEDIKEIRPYIKF